MTERLWKEERSRRIPASLRKAALKKLQMLNAATSLCHLAIGWSGSQFRFSWHTLGTFSVLDGKFRI